MRQQLCARDGKLCASSHFQRIYGGALTLSSLTLGGVGKVREVMIDGKSVAFTQKDDTLSFETVTFTDQIEVVCF